MSDADRVEPRGDIVEPSEDYDAIDILIDTDPIALGDRCRAAESRAARAEAERDKAIDALREIKDYQLSSASFPSEAAVYQALASECKSIATCALAVEYEASGEGR